MCVFPLPEFPTQPHRSSRLACRPSSSLQGKDAARRATSAHPHAPQRAHPPRQAAGRKSPGAQAESAIPKGQDPRTPLPRGSAGGGAARHNHSYVAGAGRVPLGAPAGRQLNGAYSRADVPTPPPPPTQQQYRLVSEAEPPSHREQPGSGPQSSPPPISPSSACTPLLRPAADVC